MLFASLLYLRNIGYILHTYAKKMTVAILIYYKIKVIIYIPYLYLNSRNTRIRAAPSARILVLRQV